MFCAVETFLSKTFLRMTKPTDDCRLFTHSSAGGAIELLNIAEWSSICHRVYPSLLPIMQASALRCLTSGCFVQ